MRTSWRERDLGGSHGPVPSSVAAVVGRAHFTVALARAGEAFLLGLSAAGMTLAVLALESTAPLSLARLDVSLLALVVGLATGLGWWLEHRRTPLDVARRLDERLRHQGALVTSYELECARDTSAMAGLLRARVLSRLRTPEALRAMFPPLALPVAAPILGVGLFAFALEEGRSREAGPRDVGALTLGLADALELLETGVLAPVDEGDEGADHPAAALDGQEAASVLELARRARDLARRWELFADDTEGAREELEQLDRDLAELAARVADERALTEALEDARAFAQAARAGLGPASQGVATADGEAGGAAGVTPGAADGTMPGPGEKAGTIPEGTPVVELGTLGGLSWPATYDAIVAGWIERTRDRTEEESSER